MGNAHHDEVELGTLELALFALELGTDRLHRVLRQAELVGREVVVAVDGGLADVDADDALDVRAQLLRDHPCTGPWRSASRAMVAKWGW